MEELAKEQKNINFLELPKWKIALLGIVPVAAVGAGYWYYQRNKSKAGKVHEKKKGSTQPTPQSLVFNT